MPGVKNPPPPSQQQAEEAQQARHSAELAVLALFTSSGGGGGSGDNDFSSLEAVKLVGILSLLSAAVVATSFRHPRDRSRSLLVSTIDNNKVAEAVSGDAHRAFIDLKSSDMSDEQRATLWATSMYSKVADQIALVVNANGLASPEMLGRTLRKVWISRSDMRVRPLHAKLHGKTIPVTGDFWRWPDTGQRLRWPGDREAPLDAVIGCRCVSLLTWADQDGVSRTIRKIVDTTEPGS